jgi:hypothetical protein
MRQKLKTIFINLLIIAIPIIFISVLIYIYKSDDIIEVKNQTYIQEPLTVTENHVKISNLKASYETFDESNIYGELIMRYQLNNGEEYQDRFNLEQIHNHQLPNNGSILTKTYYKGTYILRSGKTITLETADKLKKGDNIHRREDPEYQWTKIVPHTEPINTTVQIPYTVSTGKTHMTHYRDEQFTINP